MRSVYLDASFLISYLVSNHELNPKAQQILLDLLSKDYDIWLSYLGIDEVWYSLKKDKTKSQSDLKYKDFADEFSSIITGFLSMPQIRLVNEMHHRDILNTACVASKEYDLKPRDSFHFAFCKQIGATFLTADNDFDPVPVSALSVQNIR